LTAPDSVTREIPTTLGIVPFIRDLASPNGK
jgi:hypothetical protein